MILIKLVKFAKNGLLSLGIRNSLFPKKLSSLFGQDGWILFKTSPSINTHKTIYVGRSLTLHIFCLMMFPLASCMSTHKDLLPCRFCSGSTSQNKELCKVS